MPGPMIPHPNFFPPAGAVVDRTDSQVTWNGRQWVKKNKVVNVSGHDLVGKPGTSFAGWYFDWRAQKWMEPGKTPASSPQSQTVVIDRSRQPMERTMTNKPAICNTNNPLQFLPPGTGQLVSGLLIAIAELTDPPEYPPFSADMTDFQRDQIERIHTINKERYDKRADRLRSAGFALLGVSAAAAAQQTR